MEVLITNRQNLYLLSEESIKSTAYALLEKLGKTGAELSLLIVDDEQIAQINKTYLGRTGPTNVIAFPMGETGFTPLQPELLGDVVISVETAGREASEGGYSMEERFTELLIHGILHLLGYDHETNEQDAEQMNKKSDELINYLKARKKQ
ncbi:MAG: rRNA maturation RNase YbeY [bacterium]